MVRREIIRKRLNKVDEYMKVLKSLQTYSLEEFLSDPEHYGSAERFLHLTIEAFLDIGNHIIADDALGVVNWYSDIPKIFLENSIIHLELSEKWTRMIGFRNTLVHEYIDIDRHIVFDVLQNDLEDFEEMRRIFASYL